MSKSEKNPTSDNPASQTRVLEFLKSYRDPRSGECVPTMDEIATGVGLSRPRVGELISDLVKAGLVERTRGWITADGQDEVARWRFTIEGSSEYVDVHRRANKYRVVLGLILMLCAGSITAAAGNLSTTTDHSVNLMRRWLRRRFLLSLQEAY